MDYEIAPRRVSFFGLRPSLGVASCVIGLLTVLASLTRAEEPVAREYQLKAAFLYNFTKFVEWSTSKLGAPDSPILIGVLGVDPFGGELERTVLNRKVNGREIAVRRVSNMAGARAVHLLFVPASEDARLGELRDAIRNSGVVTVGESAAFAKSAGIINFVIEGDKVRFDINVAGAELAGVRISAQLQKLARTVRK